MACFKWNANLYTTLPSVQMINLMCSMWLASRQLSIDMPGLEIIRVEISGDGGVGHKVDKGKSSSGHVGADNYCKTVIKQEIMKTVSIGNSRKERGRNKHTTDMSIGKRPQSSRSQRLQQKPLEEKRCLPRRAHTLGRKPQSKNTQGQSIKRNQLSPTSTEY